MSAQGTYRFYSVSRGTILIVNGKPLGRERVNNVKNYVPINNVKTYGPINPFPLDEVLRALINFFCLTPNDFTRQWGTSWTRKG